MPSKCCVTGCFPSDYNKNEKRTFFTFPRDPSRRQLWLAQIGRENFTPTKNSFVCEVHFEEKYIIRFDSSKTPDGVILSTGGRSRPKLTKDAVPSDCSEYSIKATTKRKRNRRKDGSAFPVINPEDLIKDFNSFKENFQQHLPANQWMFRSYDSESSEKNCQYLSLYRIQDEAISKPCMSAAVRVAENLSVEVFVDSNKTGLVPVPDHQLRSFLTYGSPRKLCFWSKFESLLSHFSLEVLDTGLRTDVHTDSDSSQVLWQKNSDKPVDKRGSSTRRQTDSALPNLKSENSAVTPCTTRWLKQEATAAVSDSLDAPTPNFPSDTPSNDMTRVQTKDFPSNSFGAAPSASSNVFMQMLPVEEDNVEASTSPETDGTGVVFINALEEKFPAITKQLASRPSNRPALLSSNSIVKGGNNSSLNSSTPPQSSPLKQQYQCVLCSLLFTLKGELIRHMKKHKSDMRCKCSVCNKTFSDKDSLKFHMETQHICSVCGKTLASKFSLGVHMRRVHTGERPYKCTICEKAFSDNSTLRKHHRSHTGEKPFMCELCGKSYKKKESMTSHVLAVHYNKTKPYECESCGDCFAFRWQLKNHSIVHTREGEPHFSCNVCFKVFFQMGELKEHGQQHHKTRVRLDQGHPCTICGKVLGSYPTLWYHKKSIHENYRKYTCSFCGKGFILKFRLQIHIREKHTGEKFACSYCGKIFSSYGGFNKHVSWHKSGEKSLECLICHKTYSEPGNLKKHMKLHIGQQ